MSDLIQLLVSLKNCYYDGLCLWVFVCMPMWNQKSQIQEKQVNWILCFSEIHLCCFCVCPLSNLERKINLESKYIMNIQDLKHFEWTNNNLTNLSLYSSQQISACPSHSPWSRTALFHANCVIKVLPSPQCTRLTCSSDHMWRSRLKQTSHCPVLLWSLLTLL